jgi:hypothetical protein
MKSGGDDSEASSNGEEFTQLTFSALPVTNHDITGLASPTGTASLLTITQSLLSETTPSIVTSPPSMHSNDDTENSNERTCHFDSSCLSKTWTPSTFTGAQLRGTCSLEYAEYMRDRSHKRKTHMVDLRKDDVVNHVQQSSATTTMTSASKH